MVARVLGVHRFALIAATVVVLSGTLAFGSGAEGATSSAPGVSSTTITIGTIADITGPIPGLMQGVADGMDAWAAYVNSTGGIDGRKVIIDHEDSALSCTTTTNKVQAAVKTDFALVGGASAEDTCGQSTLQSNPSFPDIPAFLVGTNLASLPNVYLASPQPPGWRNEGFIWVKQKYGAAATKKFAALYPQVTAPEFKAVANAAQSVGYNLIYSRAVGYTESNFTADILRMKSEGIEVVDTSTLSDAQSADFLNQAAQQNFHPDAVFSFAYDNSLLSQLANKSNANNVVLALPWSLFLGQDNKNVAEIRTMTKWMKKTNPGAPLTLYVDESWAAGVLFQQAMQKMGSNVTQAGLLSALKGFNSFTANGLIPSQKSGKKIPSPCLVIAGVKNGKFVRVDPSKSGFLCSGKYVLYNGS